MANKPEKTALDTAENVLHRIYGDDFAGCTVTLEAVAEIIQAGMGEEGKGDRALVEALTEVIRAIQTLATPPDKAQVKSVQELAALLGERADAIRLVTGKALEAVRVARLAQDKIEGG